MEMKRYAWASGGGVPGCRGAEGRGEEIKSGNGNETLRLGERGRGAEGRGEEIKSGNENETLRLGERGRGAEGRAAVVESGQRLNPRGVPVPEALRRQRGGGSAVSFVTFFVKTHLAMK